MASEAELEAAYRQACDRKDDPAALAAAERLVQEYPESPWNWLRCVSPLLALGRFAEVERVLEQAQARNPDPRCTHNILVSWGRLRHQQRQYALAEEAFQSSLSTAYNDRVRSTAWFYTACAQRYLYRPHDAEQSFRKALELDPNYEEAMFNLAMCLEDMKRPDQAQSITLLRQAIEIDPVYMDAIRELGRLLWSRGDAQEGEQLLRQSLELCPRDERTYQCLAEGLGRDGRESDAIDVWTAAAAAFPEWPRPGIELCVAYLKREDPARAEACLREALKIEGAEDELLHVGLTFLRKDGPGEPLASLAIQCGLSPSVRKELLYNLTVTMHQSGQATAAASLLVRLLEEEPAHERALIWTVSIMENLDPDRGVALLRRAIDVDPGSNVAYGELGRWLWRQGHSEEGERLLRKSLELSPQDEDAYEYLAERLSRDGRMNEVVGLWTQAVAAFPSKPLAGIELCAAYLKLEKHELAEASLRQALKLDGAEEELIGMGRNLLRHDGPAEPFAVMAMQCELSPAARSEMQVLLARVMGKQGRTPEAVALLERLLEGDPNNAQTLYWIGRMLRWTDADRAIALLRRSIELEPGRAEAHRSLGVVLLIDKEAFSEAEQCFRTALRLDPKGRVACYLLALALLRQGDDRQAEAELLQLAQTRSMASMAHKELAGIYRARGDFVEAEASFRRTVELDPEDADSLAGLGMFLAETGRHDEARPLLRRALCLDPDLIEADEIREWLSLHGE